MGAMSEKALEQSGQTGFAAGQKSAAASGGPKPAEKSAIEKISEARGRAVRAEEYYWPEGAPEPDKLQEQMEREAEALARLERMGRYGVTLREKVIFYLETMYFLMNSHKEALDKPITWAAFRRLVAHAVVEYSKGRAHHD